MMATVTGTRVVMSFPGDLDDVVWVAIYAVPVVDGGMDWDDEDEVLVARWCRDSGEWSSLEGEAGVVISDSQLDVMVDQAVHIAGQY